MLPGRFAITLYVWLLLIVLATAYQRSYFAGTGVQYRYFDVMLLPIIAAFFSPRWPVPALVLNSAKIAIALWAIAWSVHLWSQAMLISRVHSRVAEIERETFWHARQSEDEAWRFQIKRRRC